MVVIVSAAAYAFVPQPVALFPLAGVLWVMFLSSYFFAPQRTILFFILLFPVMTIMPQGPRLLPGVNFSSMIVLMLMLAAWLTESPKGPKPRRNPYFAPVVFWACVLALSCTLSFLSGTQSLMKLIRSVDNYVLVPAIAPIAFHMIWTRTQLNAALGLVAISTALVSMHAMWIMPGQMSHAQLIRFEGRAISIISPQPNLFGGFLAIMVVILTAHFVASGVSKWQRLLTGLCLVAAVAGILATLSRGSWLGALAGLLYLGVWRGAKVAIVLALLGIIVAFSLPGTVTERFDRTFEESDVPLEEGLEVDPSTGARISHIKALPFLLIQSPLIGHGFNSFNREIQPYDITKKRRGAHATLAELTVEEGLAGIAAYFWLLWALASSGLRLRSRSQDPFLRSLGTGFVAAVICLFVLDLSGVRFTDAGVMTYLWLLGGALARQAADLPEAGSTPPRPAAVPS